MKEALRYGEQMLRALVSLHEEGAAALDLKPANLLFDSDRRDRLVIAPLDTASTLPRPAAHTYYILKTMLFATLFYPPISIVLSSRAIF